MLTLKYMSAKSFTCALTALLLIGGCSRQEAALLTERDSDIQCFDRKDGYGVPLCSTSFARLVTKPDAYAGRYVALKAVLSIEFDTCVLHRDYFAAENQLDLESVAIEDPQCLARAKSLMGGDQAKLVSVVGRYEREAGKASIQRAGNLVELQVLEPEVTIGR